MLLKNPRRFSIFLQNFEIKLSVKTVCIIEPCEYLMFCIQEWYRPQHIAVFNFKAVNTLSTDCILGVFAISEFFSCTIQIFQLIFIGVSHITVFFYEKLLLVTRILIINFEKEF